MKSIKKILLAALLALSFSASSGDMDLCLLTDMSPDVDDLGALQIALYYHHIDYITLKCVIVGTSDSRAHLAVKDMIRYWGYNTDEIRVGNNKSGTGRFVNDGKWVNPYIERYGLEPSNAEDGAKLLRRILNESPDLHVVEVGPATTVFNAQVATRIKHYYQMGGVAPSGKEFNLRKFPRGANYIETIPGAIYYDYQLGLIDTGQAGVFKHDTPVAFGYNTYTKGAGRRSWDLITMVGAVTGSRYFRYQRGTMDIKPDGSNTWAKSEFGPHFLAAHRSNVSVAMLIRYMNAILALRPSDVESRRRAEGTYQLPMPEVFFD